LRRSPVRFVPPREQLVGWGLLAFAAGCVATWFIIIAQVAKVPGDTQNYILAGLRLNLGHPLYGYGPGDAHVVFAGGADYPLFSPPLIAVLFRPIVLLPANGEYVWWAAMDLLEICAVAALARRAPLVIAAALIPLSLSVGMVMWQGNVDCLVVAALVLAWYSLTRRQDRRAALLIALVASLKLTPAILVWWLLVTGRYRAAVIAIGSGVALAVVAMIGSEPLVFCKFLDVTMANVESPSAALGSSGLAAGLGLPVAIVLWMPRVVLVLGVAAMWAFRRRPELSWAVAAVLMWLASPVASLHSPVVLFVALAPVAWPMICGDAGPPPLHLRTDRLSGGRGDAAKVRSPRRRTEPFVDATTGCVGRSPKARLRLKGSHEPCLSAESERSIVPGAEIEASTPGK
jgi:hypothetical protein